MEGLRLRLRLHLAQPAQDVAQPQVQVLALPEEEELGRGGGRREAGALAEDAQAAHLQAQERAGLLDAVLPDRALPRLGGRGHSLQHSPQLLQAFLHVLAALAAFLLQQHQRVLQPSQLVRAHWLEGRQALLRLVVLLPLAFLNEPAQVLRLEGAPELGPPERQLGLPALEERRLRGVEVEQPHSGKRVGLDVEELPGDELVLGLEHHDVLPFGPGHVLQDCVELLVELRPGLAGVDEEHLPLVLGQPQLPDLVGRLRLGLQPVDVEVRQPIDHTRVSAAPLLCQREALQPQPFSLEVALVAVLPAGAREQVRHSDAEGTDPQVLGCLSAADYEEGVGIGG